MNRLRTILATVGWALYLGLAVYPYVYAPKPAPILVVPSTEQSIREEIKREQKEKAYQQASKIAAQVYRRLGCRPTYADGTGRAAVDFGIPTRVLAGLVFVESSCRSTAVSGKDSVGLTQINPRVWKYSQAELRDPDKNLKIGARILSAYIKKYGLVGGLHAYNGWGNPTEEYSTKVLTAAGILVS